MRIRRYDDNDQSMRRFVYQAYTLANDGDFAGSQLYRMLRDDSAVCVVGTNDGDLETYQGFALKFQGKLVWVYVKKVTVQLSPTERLQYEGAGMKVFRNADGTGTWTLRHNGVAKELLYALGFAKDLPLPVLHHNKQAVAWKERGWDVRF